MTLVNIIVRFRNEENHLDATLAAVRAQHFPQGQMRLVGVDNCSDDRSLGIAAQYCDEVVDIDDYFPGAAINLVMRSFPCDYAAILSAHTIPGSPDWLASLFREASKPETLAVYGAQVYPFFSKFLDKRDLAIFSCVRPRLETRDSDLWNANSMIPRTSWERRPFDETVFELEDHYWSKCSLDGTNLVRFVPDAIVYHYSHDTRNDRVLPSHSVAEPGREKELAAALSVLREAQPNWPRIMMAALTVKTLRSLPGAESATNDLLRILGEHWDFDVRWRVADTLGAMPSPEGIEALITGLTDPSYYARNECAWALARIGPEAARRVRARIDGVPARERPLATLALGLAGDAEARALAVNLVQAGFERATGELKTAWIYAAGEIAAVPGIADMLPLLDGCETAQDERTRAALAWMIGEVAGKAGPSDVGARLLAVLCADSEPSVRAEAAVALGKSIGAGVTGQDEALANLRGDPVGRVRYSAWQITRALVRDGTAGAWGIPEHPDEDHGVRFEIRGLMADLQTTAETGAAQ